jgi:hypothetical protein
VRERLIPGGCNAGTTTTGTEPSARGGSERPIQMHVPERNNFAPARRPPIFFDAVAPMHGIRLALNRGISGGSIIFIRGPRITW